MLLWSSTPSALPGSTYVWTDCLRKLAVRRLSSVLVVDGFPIRLMAASTLLSAGLLETGTAVNCCMLAVQSPAVSAMHYLLGYTMTSVGTQLGWMAEFCGQSFPSRAVLIPGDPDLQLVSAHFIVRRRPWPVHERVGEGLGGAVGAGGH